MTETGALGLVKPLAPYRSSEMLPQRSGQYNLPVDAGIAMAGQQLWLSRCCSARSVRDICRRRLAARTVTSRFAAHRPVQSL